MLKLFRECQKQQNVAFHECLYRLLRASELRVLVLVCKQYLDRLGCLHRLTCQKVARTPSYTAVPQPVLPRSKEMNKEILPHVKIIMISLLRLAGMLFVASCAVLLSRVSHLVLYPCIDMLAHCKDKSCQDSASNGWNSRQ